MNKTEQSNFMMINSARSNGSGSPRLEEQSGSKNGQQYPRSKSTMGHTRTEGLNSSNNDQRIMLERIPPPINGRKDRCIHNWKAYKLESNGKKTFLDDVKREAKKKLSPVLYAKVENWAEISNSKMLHGHGHKNKIHPGNRVTFVDEAVKFDKRRHIPAPGTYNNLPKDRVLQVPKTTDKQLKMNDHCMYIAEQTPAAKYDHSKFHTITKPKIF